MVLGFLLYIAVPHTDSIGSVAAFVLCVLVIISMYGGGFATVPAYLKDMFGTRYVGAIHGLLLTAWSMAGIFGLALVDYIREYNITHGVPKAQAYNVTMYIMAGLLVIGFICNVLVKAVHHRFHMQPEADNSTGHRLKFGTNFIVGRCTASAITSASRKSFFHALRSRSALYELHSNAVETSNAVR
jgi:hypothetical protein